MNNNNESLGLGLPGIDFYLLSVNPRDGNKYFDTPIEDIIGLIKENMIVPLTHFTDVDFTISGNAKYRDSYVEISEAFHPDDERPLLKHGYAMLLVTYQTSAGNTFYRRFSVNVLEADENISVNYSEDPIAEMGVKYHCLLLHDTYWKTLASNRVTKRTTPQEQPN